ncbi:hypothetical protein CQW23_04192 [Capsicum baccatum]|uniref:Transposase MuDR plant domain-containing protein n=1 Tax=Capsicum baccatum TaxID=33114 RepID=A0A2G2XDY6_CAPBA|nr:hypothetical protein CQW23_04192 [Capsicum baccatum]
MAITTRSGKVLETSAKGKQVVDEVVRFDICKTMKQPSDMNESFVADVHYEDTKALSIEKQPTVEPLSAVLLKVDHEDNEGYEELMSALTVIESYTPKKPDCELKNRPTTNTPFDEPPMLESQELPDYLKYVFLESRTILPERADDLSEQHVEALISALRRYKRAMGWTIDDIIGDSPEKRMSQLEKDRMTTEWVETPKYWKWRPFTKVKILIPLRRNSSYDEFVASVMQSGDLDCASSDMVISYLMHSRKKVNPTIINNDVRVLMYIMDANANDFSPILRINVVERSFEEPLNSSAPPPRRPTVDDDLIDDDLNDYENDGDHPINMEEYSVHMEDFSSDSQDDEEDHGTGSQPGHSFTDEINFYYGQTFDGKKELKILLDATATRLSFDYYMEKSCTKLIKVKCLSHSCGWLLWAEKYDTLQKKLS